MPLGRRGKIWCWRRRKEIWCKCSIPLVLTPFWQLLIAVGTTKFVLLWIYEDAQVLSNRFSRRWIIFHLMNFFDLQDVPSSFLARKNEMDLVLKQISIVSQLIACPLQNRCLNLVLSLLMFLIFCDGDNGSWREKVESRERENRLRSTPDSWQSLKWMSKAVL